MSDTPPIETTQDTPVADNQDTVTEDVTSSVTTTVETIQDTPVADNQDTVTEDVTSSVTTTVETIQDTPVTDNQETVVSDATSSETTNVKYEVVDDEEDLFKQTAPATSGTSGLKNTTVNQNVTIEDRIKEFVATYSPKLYILTPCYASLCYVNYIMCMLATKELCEKYNIGFKVEFCKNDSLVSRARNNLVARAMNDPAMTHMIFIDADITWQPIEIIKLLIANKPLVGGLYPLKNYNWKKLIKDEKNPYNSNPVQTWIHKKNQSQFKNSIDDESMVQNNLLNYNVNYLSNTITIENNLTTVKHLATGFMMMKRGIIEKMGKAYPSTKYVDDVNFLHGSENDFAYALFDCGVEDGHYYSEDWLFCHRWTKMGGKIYIDITIALMHTGTEDYKGNYLATLI